MPKIASPIDRTAPKEQSRWQDDITDAVNQVRSSGTTAQRPTSALYAGRQYYDTTLGKPIWWNGTAWKLADGTAA